VKHRGAPSSRRRRNRAAGSNSGLDQGGKTLVFPPLFCGVARVGRAEVRSAPIANYAPPNVGTSYMRESHRLRLIHRGDVNADSQSDSNTFPKPCRVCTAYHSGVRRLTEILKRYRNVPYLAGRCNRNAPNVAQHAAEYMMGYSARVFIRGLIWQMNRSLSL